MRIGQKLFRSHSYNPNGSSSMIPEQIRILKSQFLRRANNHNTRISIDKSTILTHFVFLELEWMDDWIIFLNTAKLLRLKSYWKLLNYTFDNLSVVVQFWVRYDRWMKEVKTHLNWSRFPDVSNAYIWFLVEVNTFQTEKSSVQVNAVPWLTVSL